MEEELKGVWFDERPEKKKLPRVKSRKEKGFDWFIGWLLPGFHIAKNPPKGYKRPRKEKGGLT